MSAQDLIDADDRETTRRNGSRFNALKHGLTAKTAVLPGEDPELFQAKIDMYKTSLETRNPLEDDLAEKAALASWQMDRAVKIQVARANCEILTKPAADLLREDVETAALGNRLLHDRRGAIELFGSREHYHKEPHTSWENVPNQPDDPEILVRRMSATISGCRWLRSQWESLRGMLKLGLGLQSHEKFKMIRLMGRQPINAVSVVEVARVFLACHALDRQFPYAFQELWCETHEDQFKIQKRQLKRWEKVGIAPASKTAARAVLLGIINQATERLRVVEAGLQETADEIERQQKAAPGQEDRKAGEQLHRHLGSCNRLIFGNLGAIHKLRRNEADGWGRARQERAQKAGGGGKKNRSDERLVIDEHGTFRPARGYQGNLEEGLARFEAKCGSSGLNGAGDSRREIEETHVRAVPDFARWTPPVDGCGLAGDALGFPASERGAGMDYGVEAEAGFHGDRVEVEQDHVVTEVLTEQCGQSNLQNEIGDDEWSMAGGPTLDAEGGGEEACGLADGGEDLGARGPRRTENGDGGDRSGARGPRSARKKDDADKKERRLTARFWKRDRKQWRKVMARIERDRRSGGTEGDDDEVPLEELVDRVRLFPMSIDVIREQVPRSP